ncbi:hypothetical protein ACJ73_07434 [Blastomyces percursus]|uniref:Uncharacterized protein n=1 Tax=Blastomyces percursus TaxID=1658174 RepID=A0A1J9PY12_9EURO|nr:hypothetical protein ACJ73_07434 [Blastomyces percursus]
MFEVADKEFGEIDIVYPNRGPAFLNQYVENFECCDLVIAFFLLLLRAHTASSAILELLVPTRVAREQRLMIRVKTPKPPSRLSISSIAGQDPAPVTPIYCATKHAINGFVRSLAILDGIRICVSAVASGYIKTPLWTEHPERMKLLDENKDVNEMMLSDSKEAGQTIPIQGGTVLEVCKTVRAAFNDPGFLGRAGGSMMAFKKVRAETAQILQSGSWRKARV